MKPSAPLEFPSGRLLAGWWKQLGPAQPSGLWVAHLFFHQVEALFRTSFPVSVEPLQRLLLDALGRGETGEDLARRLGIGVGVATQLLRRLHAEGLVERTADGPWSLTDAGRFARASGTYARAGLERRRLHFVENEAGRPPHFVAFRQPPEFPLAAPNGTAFDLQALTRGLEQTADWKQRHGFPMDVVELVTPRPDAVTLPSWQSVIVDRPGHLIAALVRLPTDPGERLTGYALEPETWDFRSKDPLLSLGAEWPEVLPDLATEPPPGAWQEAWSGWCQRRGLPTVEVEACVLEPQVNLVRVRAPGRLLERLRAARSDALKGEAWLLAGSGRTRKAARIEVHA